MHAVPFKRVLACEVRVALLLYLRWNRYGCEHWILTCGCCWCRWMLRLREVSGGDAAIFNIVRMSCREMCLVTWLGDAGALASLFHVVCFCRTVNGLSLRESGVLGLLEPDVVPDMEPSGLRAVGR